MGELTVLDDGLVVLDRLYFQHVEVSRLFFTIGNINVAILVVLTIVSELRSTTGRGLSGNVVSSKTNLPAEIAKLIWRRLKNWKFV